MASWSASKQLGFFIHLLVCSQLAKQTTFTYFIAGLVTVISCQTSCTKECVSFFLSTTPGDVALGVGDRFIGPVTTSAVLGSRGDAGGVSDDGPALDAVSVLVSTDPSADC